MVTKLIDAIIIILQSKDIVVDFNSCTKLTYIRLNNNVKLIIYQKFLIFFAIQLKMIII